MTASPPLNGHPRPSMPVLGDWRPVDDAPKPDGEAPAPQVAPEPELVAQAKAEAIRAKAWAEAEATRTAAEAAAKAELIRAEAEARKQQLANDRMERKAREEEAATNARIADHNRRRAEAERSRLEQQRQAEERRQAAAEVAEESAAAESQWRRYARGFYLVCAIVALPVQIAAFYNPHAVWLMAAPLMLEGGAWVVLKGAAAASVARRPCWHYRLIAWLLAFIAAAINLWHGMNAFDLATAIGTAFASVAGPGVWDLYEHGRIRQRDGVLTRKERRARRKAERAEAARTAVEEALRRAEKEAAEQAAAEAAQQLTESRAQQFPKVWEHALKIAAAVGETTVTEIVWRRAHRDIEGTDPGESADVIRARNAAERRVEAAREKTTVTAVAKTVKNQRVIQTPRSSYKPVPPVRKAGDTPRYHRVAGRAHSELLRRKSAREEGQ